MTPAEFDRFSDDLRARLEADARVLALVALGSTAVPELRDAYSDHDFWVVLAPGARAAFLEDSSWLPVTEQRVASIRAGARYLVLLYATGHVVELGVFEPDELSEGKLGAYRILFDRHGIVEKLAEVAHQSTLRSLTQDDRAECERLFVILMTGAARAARGEHLSAHKYLHYFALDFLLDLCLRHKTAADPGLIDSLDPWRRVEQRDPVLAANLREVVRLPAMEAAMRLLDLTERELGAVLPDYPAHVAAVVRSVLTRLGSEA